MDASLDDSGEPQEALKPKHTFNPGLARFFQNVELRARDPSAPVAPLDPVLARHLRPSDLLLARAEPALRAFKAAFKLDKVDDADKAGAGGKRKKRHWRDILDEEMAAAAAAEGAGAGGGGAGAAAGAGAGVLDAGLREAARAASKFHRGGEEGGEEEAAAAGASWGMGGDDEEDGYGGGGGGGAYESKYGDESRQKKNKNASSSSSSSSSQGGGGGGVKGVGFEDILAKKKVVNQVGSADPIGDMRAMLERAVGARGGADGGVGGGLFGSCAAVRSV